MRLPSIPSARFALLGTVLLLALHTPAAAAAITVTPSGIDGGGFTTVFVRTPSGLLVGADTRSGFHRTIDKDESVWRPSSAGSFDADYLSTAGMMVDPDNPNIIYALNGSRGHAALLRSDDGGKTWRTWSTDPHIATNAGRQDDGLAEHPRSIGQLMVSTKANGTTYFFVGNYQRGVIVSTDPFRKWKPLRGIPDSGPKSPHIRGLAVDSSGNLWVATRENGMYECKPPAYISGDTCTRDTSSPKHVEEVRTLGADVYVAADADGVMRRLPDAGTWINLSSDPLFRGQGLPEDKQGPYWVTLDVKPIGSGSEVRIVAAAVESNTCQTRHCPAVVWTQYDPSMSNPPHWMSIDSKQVTVTTLTECSGRKWWEASSDPTSMIGGNVWVPGMISIEGEKADTFLINGRAGAIWRSTDAGKNWCPSVEGLGTTLNTFVSVQPAATGTDRVLVSNNDHTAFLSSKDLATVEKFSATKLLGHNINVGYASAFVGDRVYLAVDNDESKAKGQPMSQLVSMPATGGAYTNEHVPGTPGTDESQHSVNHVAGVAGRMLSSTQRQLVIALSGPDDQRVYVRTDTLSNGQWKAAPSWTPLTGPGVPQVPKGEPLVQLGIDKADTLYMATSNGVYSVGLARPDLPWTQLDGASSPDHALAVDASMAGRILYIRNGTVYEHTPTVAKRAIPSITNALTLAISPDGSATYVAARTPETQTQPGGEAQLWKYTTDGATPTDITTDDWKAAGKEPRAMVVGAGGKNLYVACAGPGALVVTSS